MLSRLFNILDFIEDAKVPTWSRPNSIDKLAECFDANGVFCIWKDDQLTGLLLVLPLSDNKYHACLVVAKNSTAFKQLAIMFNQRFPEGHVESAIRHGKQKVYRGNLVEKVIKYG